MPKSTIIGDIVKEYLTKYPYSSTRYIAKLIYKEVPQLFKEEESARLIVRYYRGVAGETNRKKLSPFSYKPQIVLPEPDEDDSYEPYLLEGDVYPILVGADAHMPFHNQDAVEMFFDYGLKIKPKTILLLGDWLDFYLLSHWVTDPRKRNAEDELAMFNKLLTQVRTAFPDVKIVFKYGNHEERWDDYVKTHAPEIFHVPTTHLRAQLNFDALNIDVVSDKRIIKAGHLHIIHGHEYKFNISNPVNPARGLYLRAKKSAMCGHFHQTSEHTESAINGDIVTCWSIGALCGLHPEYMPLNRWNLGFATVDMVNNSFVVSNKRIINNKLV